MVGLMHNPRLVPKSKPMFLSVCVVSPPFNIMYSYWESCLASRLIMESIYRK